MEICFFFLWGIFKDGAYIIGILKVWWKYDYKYFFQDLLKNIKIWSGTQILLRQYKVFKYGYIWAFGFLQEIFFKIHFLTIFQLQSEPDLNSSPLVGDIFQFLLSSYSLSYIFLVWNKNNLYKPCRTYHCFIFHLRRTERMSNFFLFQLIYLN